MPEGLRVDVELRFWKLCDEAVRLGDANWEASQRDASVASDCGSYEPPMVEIIQLVERHPEHRDTFVRCFCDLVQWKRPAPFELVAFCMRRLRFPEVLEQIRRDAETHGRRSAYYADHMNHWSSINHAYFDAVWEDAGMWVYYAHERGVTQRTSTGAEQVTSPDGDERS